MLMKMKAIWLIPESCVRYIEATGIDVLFRNRNCSWLYKKKPNLNFDLLKNICRKDKYPHSNSRRYLVLTEEMFKKMYRKWCLQNKHINGFKACL